MTDFLSFAQWDGYGDHSKHLRKTEEMDARDPFTRMELARRISDEMKLFVSMYDVSRPDSSTKAKYSQSHREYSHSLDTRIERSLNEVHASKISGSCPSGR